VLNYQLHMVHHCKDSKVMLIAIVEEQRVTMLMKKMMALILIENRMVIKEMMAIDNLVMIEKIVGMGMIVMLDSLMVKVHQTLMVGQQKEKRLEE